MKTQLLKTFKDKNGKAIWGVNLNNDGTFSFIGASKSCYTVSKENLVQGWWEGTIPKEVRQFAIQYK